MSGYFDSAVNATWMIDDELDALPPDEFVAGYFSVRAYNCLMHCHQPPIGRLEQLLELTEENLLSIKNLGRVTLAEIKDALARKGLELKKTEA